MPSEIDFPYTSVLITGGSSGIGKSFISHIQSWAPETLICNLSRREPTQELGKLKLRHYKVDLSSQADRRRAVSEALWDIDKQAASGSLLVINNAGFGCYGEFPTGGADAQLAILEVNLNAVLDITAQCLPVLKARGGTILNVASVTAFQPTPFIATYGASKAFLLHWGYSLGEELKNTGVNVLTVCPGSTRTNFHATAGMKSGGAASRLEQTSEQVVTEAMSALARKRRHVVTGWGNWLMTSFASLLPLSWGAGISGRVLRHLSASERSES